MEHPPAGSDCGEEGRDVAGEALGLFGGGEVAAPRHWCPLTDVVKTFGPLARRGALGDELVGEHGDRGRHLDEIIRAHRDSEPPVVEVVPDGGRDRLGNPVERDGG